MATTTTSFTHCQRCQILLKYHNSSRIKRDVVASLPPLLPIILLYCLRGGRRRSLQFGADKKTEKTLFVPVNLTPANSFTLLWMNECILMHNPNEAALGNNLNFCNLICIVLTTTGNLIILRIDNRLEKIERPERPIWTSHWRNYVKNAQIFVWNDIFFMVWALYWFRIKI